MLDQAQSFVEACGFLERLRSEYESRQLEKASKAAKRKGRR